MTPERLSSASRLVNAEASPAFARLIERGFLLAERTGFYPRVRGERKQPWNLAIDFWMRLDEAGKYRTEWSQEAPFELGGAAAIDRQEGMEVIRYWKPHVLYVSRPYDDALRTLATDLIELAEVIESWSEETVIGTGKRATIRTTSST
jgi:hypothetical protein